MWCLIFWIPCMLFGHIKFFGMLFSFYTAETSSIAPLSIFATRMDERHVSFSLLKGDRILLSSQFDNGVLTFCLWRNYIQFAGRNYLVVDEHCISVVVSGHCSSSNSPFKTVVLIFLAELSAARALLFAETPAESAEQGVLVLKILRGLLKFFCGWLYFAVEEHSHCAWVRCSIDTVRLSNFSLNEFTRLLGDLPRELGESEAVSGIVAGPVMLINGNNTIDLSSNKRSYKIGLDGEDKALYSNTAPIDKSWHSEDLPTHRWMVWYKAAFKAPLGTMSPFAIDESSMTGESTLIHKDQKAPFLISGCKVAEGYGTMLVTGVGINTEWGLLMASISEDNGEATPLQVRLNGVATFIGIVGLLVAVFVLAILLIRYFTKHTESSEGSVQFKAGKTSLSTAVNGVIQFVTIVVTIVVVAVPEGLPLAVTLTLAYSIRKMMADKALGCRLSACETMGSTITICYDKTGTLTLSQMTIVRAFIGGEQIDPPEQAQLISSTALSLLLEGIAQNTTGTVFEPEDGGAFEVTGSPTNKAILHGHASFSFLLFPSPLTPSLNFLSVTGDYSEDEMSTASYGYIGDHEGKSLYYWYLHEGENEIGVQIPEASGLRQYRITKEAIGKFVSFKCIPVRDGVVGEPSTCLGQEHVCPGSPRLLSLQIVGEEIEASVLNIYKKYWGGEEGDSVFCWFVTSPDGTVREIKSASAVSYTPSKEDIGCCISISCEPVRSDWSRGRAVIFEKVGPILPGPLTCQALELHGSMMEGQHLGFIATYSGGEIGNCTYEWYRVKGRGLKDKISGNKFLDLALEDVGKCIELVYMPM